jgi:hypothetical protein
MGNTFILAQHVEHQMRLTNTRNTGANPVRISHDAEMVKIVADRLLKEFYKDKTLGRTGYHRSDAISCPLRAYWRLTGEVQGEYRSHDVGIMMLGEMAHVVLERGFDYKEKIIKVGEVNVTVDATLDDFPIEIKTTRKQIYRKEDVPREWQEQLSIAISVMDKDYGWLLIMNVITCAFMCFKFDMSPDEREMFRQAFIWQILSIADAVKQKKPELLTPKYDECGFCYYRPTKTNLNGCKFYRQPPKKPRE